MRMDAQAVRWIVFLALIQNISTGLKKPPFQLEPGVLTAKEGSCAEIKCKVINSVEAKGAHWFWMKDAVYVDGDFKATIIYSSNSSVRDVSHDFVDRVEYKGSSTLSLNGGRTQSSESVCSIVICNLRKSDAGHYSFRFVGKEKWVTQKNVTLKVQENPCPLTFENPPAVNDSEMIELTCSTSRSCTSKLKIEDLTQHPPKLLQKVSESSEKVTYNFKASVDDDGNVFSCQTQDNKDKYLIRNISVTVVYAPKEIQVSGSINVKEGDSVNLNCSAKGSPSPTLSWFKEDGQLNSRAEWRIASIKESQSGVYYCKAENKYGKINSSLVHINVSYVPIVEITTTSSEVRQGDQMILKCNVKRSKPQPASFTWLKDEIQVGERQTFTVEDIMPEDRGYYKCTATNSAGTGESELHQIKVNYRPRETHISLNGPNGDRVKVNYRVVLTCGTDANPKPLKYSWYRYKKNKQPYSSQWHSRETHERYLEFKEVQRADEACYMCNATNSIDTGDDSVPFCIEVLYPPTEPTLTMGGEVREGQHFIIKCTVESFPTSTVTLMRKSKSRQYTVYSEVNNTLQHSFIVTSDHAGNYTCIAKNSEGLKESRQKDLVVKFAPKNVMVEADPNPTVNENKALTLRCTAHSNPSVSSVTWRKRTTDGKDEIIKKSLTFTINSASHSDHGQYSCEASNEIGTGYSKPTMVHVRYAPKEVKILMSPERQEDDGRRARMLSCISHCYPPVSEYSWFRKDEKRPLSEKQNYTVYSKDPGDYYCRAKNEIGQKLSDMVNVFNFDLIKIVKIVLLSLSILLVISMIFLVYRRKNSNRQGSTNAQPSFGLLGWCNGARRGHLINESAMAEPFRSRDDLLPDQQCRPRAIRHQPHPDSTPASNITTVYYTANLPYVNQAPAAQNPARQQDWHKEDYSLNYASLQFRDKNKEVDAETAAVYAKVSKPDPTKKNEQKSVVDYENVQIVRAPISPNPLNDDSETSDEEVELNYTQVHFTPNPGHQAADSDSSTSDDDAIQYSDIKI